MGVGIMEDPLISPYQHFGPHILSMLDVCSVLNKEIIASLLIFVEFQLHEGYVDGLMVGIESVPSDETDVRRD